MLKLVVFNKENEHSMGGTIIDQEVSDAYRTLLDGMLHTVTTPEILVEVLLGDNPEIYIWDDEVDDQAYFKFGIAKASLSNAIIHEDDRKED